MTPFPCSDPGPRCRLLWPISSQHLLSITCTLLFLSTATHETATASKRRCSASATKPGPSLFFSPSNTSCWDGPTSDQRASFSRHIKFIPPPAPLSRTPPHGGDHHDPHDPKDAIISIPGPWLGLGPSGLSFTHLPAQPLARMRHRPGAETLARYWWRPGRRNPGTTALSLLDVVTG